MSTRSTYLGSMFKYDCRARVNITAGNPHWLALQFDEHTIGYVENTEGVRIQTCPGSPLVTTTSAPSPSNSVSVVAHTITITGMMTTSTPPSNPSTTSTTVPITTETTPSPITTTTTVTTSTEMTTPPSPTATTSAQTPVPYTESTIKSSTTSSTLTTTTTVMDSTVATSAIPGVQYGCAEKYFQHAITFHGQLFTMDNTCYELVHTPTSWTSAEGDCQRRGGHLVHINNDNQQNRLYDVVKQYHHNHVWIGLNDRATEEHFVWSSESPVNYTHWHPGRDSLLPEILLHEDCVRIDMAYNGQWEDTPCGDDYGYICEFATSLLAATTTAVPNTQLDTDGDVHVCPSRVQYYAQTNHLTVGQFNQSCYELLKTTMTWGNADDICRRSGGHLVSINDATEQQYIQGFMMRHDPRSTVWVGLFDKGSEGVYHWLSGEKVTYTNWVSGHVDHGSKDCVILDPARGGVWDDGDCSPGLFMFGNGENHHYGLCEFKLQSESQHSAVLVG
ncbi:macrophage mannose receptor 1-like [Mya arenaria]|uniref:macrophage mannose receptor 1-like n=1 Tax=Mya arenaria TaxID=6604 RepID=UPI0022DF508C|nr:macrophage mannose receptor 1-like [Mya arenaria]